MQRIWLAPLSSLLFVAALLVTIVSFVVVVAASYVRPTPTLVLLAAMLFVLLVIGRALSVLTVQMRTLVRQVTLRGAPETLEPVRLKR